MAVNLGMRRSPSRPARRPVDRRHHEGTEPGVVHPRPVPDQPARARERRRDAGLARHVVPAGPDRLGHRRDRLAGDDPVDGLPPGVSPAARRHADDRDVQGRPARRHLGAAAHALVEPSDGREDRDHRDRRVRRVRRRDPAAGRRVDRVRRLVPRRARSATARRRPPAPPATCSAATPPPGPTTRRSPRSSPRRPCSRSRPRTPATSRAAAALGPRGDPAQADATSALRDAGFPVASTPSTAAPGGHRRRPDPAGVGQAIQGQTVTLIVSTGRLPPAPPPPN